MSATLNRFRDDLMNFSITHTPTFYFGILISVMAFIILTSVSPISIGVIFTPLIAVMMYIMGVLVKTGTFRLQWSPEFGRGMMAALIASLWVLLLAVI